jgi:osmotically-inducible protein OsmY
MKPIASLKVAVSIACAAFALGAYAQTTQSNEAAPAASSSAMSGSTAKSKLSNGTITTKVKAKLLATSGLKSTGIHVHTRGSTVTLTGHVPTADQKSMARDTAAAVDGVASVKNRLKVVEE